MSVNMYMHTFELTSRKGLQFFSRHKKQKKGNKIKSNIKILTDYTRFFRSKTEVCTWAVSFQKKKK